MAPAIIMMESLVKRYTYDCDGFGNCYQNSNWDNWGRWVALAVIVVVALSIAFVFSYLSNRRRRRRGMAPMYGTGWMPGNPKTGQHYNNNNNQQPGYYGQNQRYAPPPPPYVGSQATGTTFNSNDGYYGHHGQQAYEMQPPQQSYQPQRGGENVYDAPAGPPPGKTADGIIG